MAIVKVVSGYVDLDLAAHPAPEFHALGKRLGDACGARLQVVWPYVYDDCWLAKETAGLPPANVRAADRFMTGVEHVRSNTIQHSPMEWMRLVYDQDPVSDVFVWLGYTIMKQGAFTGKPITEAHVREFLEKVERWTPDCIPLPGITGRAPVDVHGNNWRFCGSTLIVPRQFVVPLERAYKFEAREFVRKHQCIPIDLAIWPAVEANSGLPIRWYGAEYDATQLTNFPG